MYRLLVVIGVFFALLGGTIPAGEPTENKKPDASQPEPPPVSVPYEMPMDGFVAVNIHDQASGKLVRRLVAETHREKGSVQEGWDLKDENGQPVPPGSYSWNGIARPPFKLTYEISVYNAGIPAWFAPPPAKGGGSWLADHTMANCVAKQKDRMWISAPCAESGCSMIATDLDGVKQWGTGMGHFGFDGPRKVAADDRCGYAATVNMLFRVDPTREFAARNIYTFPNEATLPWISVTDVTDSASGGLAVRDGRLYYAVCGASSWLKSSFVSDSVDPSRCKPLVYLFKGKGRRQGRTDKNYDFYAYDELMLLYSTFNCDRTPAETPTLPNTALNSISEASFGDAPTSGPYKDSVVLAFRHPIPIGSILIPDGAIQVFAMRPGKTMPDSKGDAAAGSSSGVKTDADDQLVSDMLQETLESEGAGGEWIPLPHKGAAGRPTVINAPEGGLKTAALRFKVKRLRYCLVMTHRFEEVGVQAKRLFREGAETPAGGWRVTRTDTAINDFRPAMAALAWPGKQKLRGITLERTPGGTDHVKARIAVDAWVGEGSPPSADALDQEKSWKQIAYSEYAHAPMVHQMDFGGIVETSGLRIRFLNVRKFMDKFEAGFDSIVAYHPIGGEAKDLPPDLTQRVSVFKLPPPDDDKQSATVERHIPLSRPGHLAFDNAGALYAISDGQVVTVPLKEGETPRVVLGHDKLENPLAFDFAPDGLLYVTDNGPKTIKVFKPESGELVRSIGTPGGLVPGKWDPLRLNCPTGLAVDQEGRIWVADWCWSPKRVARFTPDGKFDKQFLGPTQYGGGGTMDPRDHRIIYYAGMKFVIDYEKRTWRLDSLLGKPVDKTIYFRDHRYLVGPTPGGGKLVSIAEEKDNLAKLMAQAGMLREWTALGEVPELREKFGGLDLDAQLFVWSDRNGDRQPQASEVQLMQPLQSDGSWTVGEDLTILSRTRRLRPVEIRPDGVPVYDASKIETYNSSILQGHNDNPWGDDEGKIFMTGAKLIEADGQTMRWNYPNKFNHHDGFYASGFGYNRPPGVLNQEHSPIGHLKFGDEEYYISNSDEADWFCYSKDGLLVGCIMGGPAGYGKKAWTMPEWEPGKLDLSDLRPGQEHYQGCVVRAEDGKVYAIAGHNHISVVRVDGLEKVQRIQGTVKITPEDIEKTRLWAIREAARKQAALEPKLARMLRSPGGPQIDGELGDWPNELFVTVWETSFPGLHHSKIVVDCNGALAFDSNNLYVAVRVHDESPLSNNAGDLLTLFKNGDAVDVTLGLDAKADDARMMPAAGDIRLLFAKVKGKPVAVLYKPVDPDAPADKHREFSSPVGRLRMDRVEVISSAQVAFTVKKLKVTDGQQVERVQEGTYCFLEAAVPWKALGVTPPTEGARLRGDFGFLESDENGTQTAGRKYWSGKTQTVICDLPSEARLNPALWGHFEVIKPTGNCKLIQATKALSPDDLLKPTKATGDDELRLEP